MVWSWGKQEHKLSARAMQGLEVQDITQRLRLVPETGQEARWEASVSLVPA